MLLNPAEWLRLEKAFLAWADTQPTLRAAIAVGSRERTDPPPDEWSDLDLMLFLIHPEDFARQQDWIVSLGEPWAAILNHLPSGEAEWLVTFAGGYNVDFVLVDAGGLDWLAQAVPLPEPFARGYRILVDKDGLAARISPPTGRPPAPALPSAEEFSHVVSGFWYTAYYAAKQIRRGDLFVAKVRQGNLVEYLMKMLAWHAQVTRGTEADIWHMGRFMERWADPQALAGLPALFAYYDALDSWRALLDALPLFRRLAQETADSLCYPYPTTLDEHLSTLVITLAPSLS